MLLDDLCWAVERLQHGAALRGDEQRRSAFNH